MILYGSTASPYVRRVRMLLHGSEYDFKPINIFSKEGLDAISPYSKTRRIPLLIDGNKSYFDSYLICEHLLDKPISEKDKKDLFLINDANDSAITIFQLKKFDLDPKYLNEFSQNQISIIDSILLDFENRIESENMPWVLTGQWLYNMIDWFLYRDVHPLNNYPNLLNFLKTNSNRDEVKMTDPRN